VGLHGALCFGTVHARRARKRRLGSLCHSGFIPRVRGVWDECVGWLQIHLPVSADLVHDDADVFLHRAMCPW